MLGTRNVWGYLDCSTVLFNSRFCSAYTAWAMWWWLYITAAQEGALSTPANGLIKLIIIRRLLLVGVGGKNHVYSSWTSSEACPTCCLVWQSIFDVSNVCSPPTTIIVPFHINHVKGSTYGLTWAPWNHSSNAVCNSAHGSDNIERMIMPIEHYPNLHNQNVVGTNTLAIAVEVYVLRCCRTSGRVRIENESESKTKKRKSLWGIQGFLRKYM